jgi:tetratricopeptide (TPR) repeat protein
MPRNAGESRGIAGEAVDVVAQQAETSPYPPMVLSGNVPPLADPYYKRLESVPDLTAGLRAGQVMVLTPPAAPTAATAPTAAGGTGKTQLAVEFAQAMWSSKAVAVLVWIAAANREAVISGFAQAAAVVGAGDMADSAEVAAARFTTWLAHTKQPWAVVIDDLTRLADLDGLWPAGPAGQVIITTRLAGLAGPPGSDPAPVVVPVGGFSRREALDHLNARLTSFPDQRIEALDLSEDLDGLPLGIAQAAAVMTVRELDCRQYRAMLSERRKHLAATTTAADGVSTTVLATWSLAAECAHELPPEGLAWPALALAAMLDPHGIPGAVLTSPAACSYITGHPSTASGPDQNLVRRVIGNLARVGLVTIDPATPVRTVRMHPSTQAAVRAFIPLSDLEQIVIAAADALLESWPEGDGGVQLDQALRDCSSALRDVGSAMLWKPDAHPLLFRSGLSFDGSRLGSSAIAFWQSMVSTSTRLLGPAHVNTVTARDRLAIAYESAGRIADAISVFASALHDRERNLGAEHPDTIATRTRLAHAYASAQRPEAIAIYERTVADSDRQLGPGHQGTMSARAELADAYQTAGLTKDAIRTCQLLLTDAERLLGSSHGTSLAARASLAEAFLAAGQPKDAIEQYKRVLVAQETLRGRDHPDTIAARASLASALRKAGKIKEAIAAYERVLADRERVQGPDHRNTRTARANLAGAYQQAGRAGEAIPHFERALADSERMQGPGDIETLTARCSLAAVLFLAGRLMEVVTVLQRALADCERYLGPDHPMTRTVRDNLKTATAA